MCTLIGCTDAWVLQVVPDGGPFANGVYAVTTTIDGESTVCDWEVRSAGCEMGGPCIVEGSCPNALYSLGEATFTFEGTPAEIDYRVTRNGLQLAGETLMPTYEEVRPNGPGCEPVCRQVWITASVPGS